MEIKKIGLAIVKNYLRAIVGLLLWVKKPTIIAVTGTAGKTTTKETIYAVLHQKFKDQVERTHGSLSTKTGLPIGLLGFTPNWTNSALADASRDRLGPAWWQWPWWLFLATIRAFSYLTGIKPYPKLWVVEFAADLPQDFDFLLSYIHPSISVVTNVGPAHAEFFGSVEAIAKEKGKIVEVLPKEGVAVLNYNDEFTQKMSRRTHAKIQWVRAKGLSFAPAAARIIGRLFEMSYPEIERGLKKVSIPAARLDIIRGKNSMALIDSSYNANPLSMEAALEVLRDYPRRSIRDHRKIAILGEMLELGNHSQKAHEQVYKQARLIADEVVTIGHGFKNISKGHFADLEDLFTNFLPQLKSGDIILIKGSHGVGLNKLVEQLKQ